MRIIMDVFLRDDNRIITVEMQTGHKKELPKRSRYYQSVVDVSTTPTGAKYRHLPDNILIFICTFDPFDRDLPRYTFQYTCNEAPTLKLQDGSLRIFLNTTATELSDLDQKLQAFYHYLQKGVVESELARTISDSITTLKNNSLERRHYMTWAVKMADARYDGYDEGYEEGISIGNLSRLQHHHLAVTALPDALHQPLAVPAPLHCILKDNDIFRSPHGNPPFKATSYSIP